MYDTEHLDNEDLRMMHVEIDADLLAALAWEQDLASEGSEDPTDAGRLLDAISQDWRF